jgi:glycosyltransferase involved in cell wall biosynthesis
VRVLYFTRDYTPHDHRFLTALADTSHQIYLLRLERRGMQLEDRVLPEKVEQVLWKGGLKPARLTDGPALAGDLMRVIHSIKPDLIHAGPIQTSAFLTALSRFRPLVSMSWGSDLLRDADRNGWWRYATRFTLQRTTVLVGDCRAVSEKAQSFGFPADRVVLFPWGVDLQKFCPEEDEGLRQRLGWQDAFAILSLRSWEPLYGVDVLVKAFVLAAQTAPQLRLILLGGGSQSAMIHRILAENGLLERVYLGGQISQNELTRFYHAADLYLSASHSDGSSVSLMEALACGKPVLVSDIPGNQEWISHGQEGWLFPDGNVKALAEGIINAMNHPEMMTQMGQAARARAEQRADWTQNFQRLLEAYDLAQKLN